MGWDEVLSSRNFWLIVAAYLPMLALCSAVMQNVAPIAVKRGFSEQAAGLLLAVLSCGQLVATLGSGVASDRIGSRLPLLGLAVICASGGAIVATGASVPVLMAGAFFAAFGGGFWPVVAAALETEFGASHVGRALGAAIFLLRLAVLAPFGLAKVEEITGTYVPGLSAMIAVTLLGALACLFMREKSRAHVASGEPAISQRG